MSFLLCQVELKQHRFQYHASLLESSLDLTCLLKIQWVPQPFSGHFATTASDNKIKIWREDPSQAILSGRRFRCIFSQSPASRVTYTSFSFHAQGHNLYLALFTQDGLLSLLEPSEPKSLAGWREIDKFYPFGRHARGTEPRFCLCFQQVSYNPSPLTSTSIHPSIDPSIHPPPHHSPFFLDSRHP